jgi:hypothetical protein
MEIIYAIKAEANQQMYKTHAVMSDGKELCIGLIYF